jgi:hypothetical protein
MKMACALFLAGGLVTGVAVANDAPASDASILELLELTNAHQLVDGLKTQVDTMVGAATREALKGRTLTPDVQAVVDHMAAKMRAAAGEMMNWDALLPLYMRMYRESFTEDELAGVIAFYKTPAGTALIRKMPTVMRNLMTDMQGLSRVMNEKLVVIEKEAVQELQDLQDKKRSGQGASTS